MIHDIVVDTLFEENLQSALRTLGTGRLVMDRDDPNEPLLVDRPGRDGEDGFLVVRVRDRDPLIFARELERRVSQMRIVEVVDRTPQKKEQTDGN